VKDDKIVCVCVYVCARVNVSTVTVIRYVVGVFVCRILFLMNAVWVSKIELL
jgi:hypothetical protein